MVTKKKATTPAGTERQMERIMDKLQSLQIAAGYSDAPPSTLRAVYEYAKANIPNIQKLRRDLKASDKPWRADGAGIRNTRGGYEWRLRQIVQSPRYSNIRLSRRAVTNTAIRKTLKRVRKSSPGARWEPWKSNKVVLQQYRKSRMSSGRDASRLTKSLQEQEKRAWQKAHRHVKLARTSQLSDRAHHLRLIKWEREYAKHVRALQKAESGSRDPSRYVKGELVRVHARGAVLSGVVYRQLKNGTVIVRYDDSEGYSGDPKALMDVHPANLERLGSPGPRRDRGKGGTLGSRSGSHVYRLNIQPLEKEPHEHVELYRTSDPLAISWNGGYIVIAYRYGKELTRFIPTRPMLKRLMNEIPGPLTITKQMIDRARLIVPLSAGQAYGR